MALRPAVVVGTRAHYINPPILSLEGSVKKNKAE